MDSILGSIRMGWNMDLGSIDGVKRYIREIGNKVKWKVKVYWLIISELMGKLSIIILIILSINIG